MLNSIDRNEIANFVKPFYMGPTRFFHNWDHILSGEKYFDKMSDEQYIAWMFHDIVYLPGSPDNEKNSADYFKFYSEQKKLNINNEVVYKIIIDTKMHISTIEDSLFILDIDMLCLSLDYEDFYQSRINVIKEYSPVFGYNETVEGTKVFLKNILGKNIYFHDFFKDKNVIVGMNILKYIK